MLKELAQYIVDLRKPNMQEIDGRTYTDKSLTVVKNQIVEPLRTSTLDSILDYIAHNVDGIKDEKKVIHIESYDTVKLYKNLDSFNHRECYLVADALLPTVTLDRFLPLENFNIQLQSTFVPSENTETVLRVCGNIIDNDVKEYGDDGVSQQVTAKKGIAMVENVKVPNRTNLRPYRTFAEVEQPESSFVLRLKKDQREDQMVAGLFEADGGAWKLQAIKNIKEYLQKCVKEQNVVIMA